MGILASFQFGTLTNNTIIKRNNIFKCLKEKNTEPRIFIHIKSLSFSLKDHLWKYSASNIPAKREVNPQETFMPYVK